MLLDASGNSVSSEEVNKFVTEDTVEPKQPEMIEVELNVFDPAVITKSLNGKAVCECVAWLKMGVGTPKATIDEAAQNFWNYGIKEGNRKSDDVSHIHYARQAIKDLLVTADFIYTLIDNYEEPEEVELAEDEDDSNDSE